MAWVPHHKHPGHSPRANPTEPTTTHREPQVLCRTPPLPRQVPHPIITPRLTLPAPSTPASSGCGPFGNPSSPAASTPSTPPPPPTPPSTTSAPYPATPSPPPPPCPPLIPTTTPTATISASPPSATTTP